MASLRAFLLAHPRITCSVFFPLLGVLLWFGNGWRVFIEGLATILLFTALIRIETKFLSHRIAALELRPGPEGWAYAYAFLFVRCALLIAINRTLVLLLHGTASADPDSLICFAPAYFSSYICPYIVRLRRARLCEYPTFLR